MDGTTRHYIREMFTEEVTDTIVDKLTKIENKHSLSLHDLCDERRLKIPYIRDARTELIWKLYKEGISNGDTAKLLKKSKSFVSVIVVSLREKREVSLVCDLCGKQLDTARMRVLGFNTWDVKVPAGFVVTCKDC